MKYRLDGGIALNYLVEESIDNRLKNRNRKGVKLRRDRPSPIVSMHDFCSILSEPLSESFSARFVGSQEVLTVSKER